MKTEGLTLRDALAEQGVRMSFEDRWLVLDAMGFTVRQKGFRMRNARIVTITNDEGAAVFALLNGRTPVTPVQV